MHNDWAAAMADMYRELDGELSGLGADCDGCGQCCHFELVDHVLYASTLERLYLAATAAVPEDPDAEAAALAAGLRCPFQKGNRCHARSGRVLGCRLHFCSWPRDAALPAEDLAERWHSRLKELHDRLGVAWNYAPLLPWKQGGA